MWQSEWKQSVLCKDRQCVVVTGNTAAHLSYCRLFMFHTARKSNFFYVWQILAVPTVCILYSVPVSISLVIRWKRRNFDMLGRAWSLCTPFKSAFVDILLQLSPLDSSWCIKCAPSILPSYLLTAVYNIMASVQYVMWSDFFTPAVPATVTVTNKRASVCW